ncbi:MAG: hypothetical protein II500_04175, partial [Campylobacter sp.]|nr:hypothetical protein [Campylobacter sp.]
VEEEIAKESLEAANDEIERLEKIVTNKEQTQKELQEKEKALNGEFDELEASLKTQIEEIEKERSEIYAKRDKLVVGMNQKMLSFYEKIRKWAGNTAVIPVKKQACYGCFMKLNDKTYSSVIRSDDIVTCPYCGRILYKEAE